MKKRLSLELSNVSNALGTDHFQFVSKEAEDLQKGFVPGNTQRSTQWVMKVFFDWKKAREVALEEAYPEDLLERANPEDLVRWLSLLQKHKTVKGTTIRQQQFLVYWQGFFNQAQPPPFHHFQPLRQKSWIRLWKAYRTLTILVNLTVHTCVCMLLYWAD